MAHCWCGSEPCVGPKNLLPGFVCRQAVEGGYTYHDSSLVPAPAPSAVQELEAVKVFIHHVVIAGKSNKDVLLETLAEIDARLSRLANSEGTIACRRP